MGTLGFDNNSTAQQFPAAGSDRPALYRNADRQGALGAHGARRIRKGRAPDVAGGDAGD